MNAMPQPAPDYSASAPPECNASVEAASTESLGDAIGTGPAKAPPHLLWETLETAFGPPVESYPEPHVERLAPYVALPIIVGSSLAMWAIIVELVLRR